MSKNKNIIDLSIILEVVCEYFGIDDKKDIFIDSRKDVVLVPRQWFHYFSRILNPQFTISLTYIGAYYSDVTSNKFDHATVLNSNKKIQNYIDSYPQWKETRQELLYLIKLKKHSFELDGNKLTGNCTEQSFVVGRN